MLVSNKNDCSLSLSSPTGVRNKDRQENVFFKLSLAKGESLLEGFILLILERLKIDLNQKAREHRREFIIFLLR